MCYFVVKLNLCQVQELPTRKFPLRFWIIKELSPRLMFKSFTMTHRRGLIDKAAKEKYKILRQLDECDVYLSTRERMPNAENCEKHVRGLTKTFTFGDPDDLRWPQVRKNPELNIYIGIKFGSNDLDEDESTGSDDNDYQQKSKSDKVDPAYRRFSARMERKLNEASFSFKMIAQLSRKYVRAPNENIHADIQ